MTNTSQYYHLSVMRQKLLMTDCLKKPQINLAPAFRHFIPVIKLYNI